MSARTTPAPGEAPSGGIGIIGLPGLAIGIPATLVLAIVLAQIAFGGAWLPVVRRTLGSIGLRRSKPPDPEVDQPLS
ncbi:MAG: hypothetical protein M3Y88_04840 [Chloroflexota bacterium]|nr:hypothetical protein [Chloroflexota bacterium]